MTIILKIDGGKVRFAIVTAEPKVKGSDSKYHEPEYEEIDYSGLFTRLKGWLNGTNNGG